MHQPRVQEHRDPEKLVVKVVRKRNRPPVAQSTKRTNTALADDVFMLALHQTEMTLKPARRESDLETAIKRSPDEFGAASRD
jgi:hypothetical protein